MLQVYITLNRLVHVSPGTVHWVDHIPPSEECQKSYPQPRCPDTGRPRRCGSVGGACISLDAPTAGSLTPCSPPSRRHLEAAELVAGASRRWALTAAARGVPAPARVGTEKRISGRTKKLTRRKQRVRLRWFALATIRAIAGGHAAEPGNASRHCHTPV